MTIKERLKELSERNQTVDPSIAEVDQLIEALRVAVEALQKVQCENKMIEQKTGGPSFMEYWREQEVKSRMFACEALTKIEEVLSNG